MKKINKKISMIPMVLVILSFSLGGIPQIHAGTQLTVDLQPFCGFSHNEVDISETTTPPADAIFQIELVNAGTATLPVSASLGDYDSPGSPVGGFSNGARSAQTDVAILPQDVDVDAADIFGVDEIAEQPFQSDGTSVTIANLGPTGAQGEGSPRAVTITAHTDNLQNLPRTGVHTADLTLTGGTCT